ncbi:pyridoxal-phosphate-dependent aminotransferase family protein [Paeniroseomonas aquatica]|uniref:Aminotransferase class V-fold PLP-dependent enzyme n=1 Tax=Paeniroseomonas aquatica TaxID=373043 RepID=A0ABT8AA38_9PROT|nr:aminotransferase class V-fold PLP-dependent enzyme [Paeniroseomonas aquatica]MDN3566580.1 aminotransferase class V-fold PLP-dependent enzyme [Paeniroseomonas aquatica]
MAYYQSSPSAGRHFLQIPGPTNVPDRVLRAMDNPTMDHRGPDFGRFGGQLLEKVKQVFKTSGPVVIYPASGTGAWEAALVNTLSPGDRVLMCETGWFAHLWQEMAERLDLRPELLRTDWRRGADVPAIEAALRADRDHGIKAVCVVHNETSTGATSRIDEVRRAIDAAGHPALLLVDTISSLGSIDYRHDEWGVDVTIAGSQKGLMLPPGLSFNAVSAKALRAAETAKLTRSFWDWRPMIASNATGYFPYTPATNLLYGLDAALDMLAEEGLENVFARHDRFAEAARRAVRHWGGAGAGIEIQCDDPRHFSSVLTAVRLPEGHSANALRGIILEKFNMSLGNGLGRLNDRVFRIGHLGDFGPLSLVGALGGVEMGLAAAGIPHQAGGVQAAMAYLNGNA